MTPAQHQLGALMRRIEQAGYTTTELDVFAMLEAIQQSHGGHVDLVDDFTFLTLLAGHELADQTQTPCPTWCQYEPGHRYEQTTDDGVQLRSHARRIEHGITSPEGAEGLYLAVTAEDQRHEGRDDTLTSGTAALCLVVDCDLTTTEARQLAGALLNGADLVDQANAEHAADFPQLPDDDTAGDIR